MPTLDWLNREAAFRIAARVPTRVLRPHPAGHRHGEAGAPATGAAGATGATGAAGGAVPGNLLVQGDNLEALKALLPFYRGQVKCIFIDPPYNTKSAFEHYDDNLEHSQWLTMMLPRLQLLREFLREDGSIWVTIDDNEGHYLKVLMDEVFGRGSFLANCVWRASDNSNNDAKTFSVDHNHLLVFARAPGWLSNKLDSVQEKRTHFKNPDDDPRGPWFDGNPLNSPKPRDNLMYNLTAPNGNVIRHPRNGWRWEPETMQEKLASGEVRFNETMTAIRRRTYLSDMKGLPPSTLWIDLHRTGHNRQAKAEQKSLVSDSDATSWFATPKPEKLLAEVLSVATSTNDLVLDSFLGSGTTAAVAHKMGRRWIGIEAGEHAVTHCLPRLQKVVQGEQGGISKAVQWQGGGGFEFVTLGAPLFDTAGDLHTEVRFADLAAYLWLRETGTALPTLRAGTPFLGRTGGAPGQGSRGLYLLYNGVLGDARPAGGNVLTTAVLEALRGTCAHDWPRGPKVVYGEACRLGEARLAAEGITFKQLPHALPR